jgi:hypothetical protein
MTTKRYSAAETRRYATFGEAAVDAGTPDRGMNGDGLDADRTDAIDTIANVLHWLNARGIDADCATGAALAHFRAERMPATGRWEASEEDEGIFVATNGADRVGPFASRTVAETEAEKQRQIEAR